MKKRVTVCMLAALVLAAGCGNNGQPSGPVSESSTENVQETETEEQPYQVEMVNYAKSDLVDINYPQITGWSNEEKQQEWNEIFEDAAIQMAGGMTGDTEESPLGENDSVSMTFTVEEQSDELLSLTCHTYYAYEGAAHPSAALTSYNIDMQTGEKVTFADMADPEQTAALLFDGTEGYTLLDAEGSPSGEITMRDVLEYNFIWMEPTQEALAASLSHFDGSVEDYGENETMGYSYRRDGTVCLIFYVNHAMGDYVIVELE